MRLGIGFPHQVIGTDPAAGLTVMQRLERAIEIKRVLELELGY